MTKADNDSRVIARKLLIFVTCFYLIYYLVSIVAVGSSRAGWSELGRFPFRINKEDFNPGGSGPALGARYAQDMGLHGQHCHPALGSLLPSLLLSITAEIVIYRLRDLREIALDS
ncbi:predicted protein [Haematococcus lacustris]|uniref:Uncharacterized protein n=1 Tax=Haematococcus lacustris TaxID=44745 RepID=A0A699ZGV1_HAELA|nr:predicted protein [Haematococcus lacustris]